MMTWEAMIKDVMENGQAEWPDFLSHAETRALRDEALLLHQNGAFKTAGIGRGRDHTQNTGVRLDETLWFDEEKLRPAQQALWSRLHEMMAELNRALYLGLWEIEGHFAFYQPGAFYARHVDRFQDDDLRVVSCVVYLNLNWQPGDGGELKFFNRRQSDKSASKSVTGSDADSGADSGAERGTVIEPAGGKLVCFLSDKTEHEVLRTLVPRLSFAGWFRCRPKGQMD